MSSLSAQVIDLTDDPQILEQLRVPRVEPIHDPDMVNETSMTG